MAQKQCGEILQSIGQDGKWDLATLWYQHVDLSLGRQWFCEVSEWRCRTSVGVGQAAENNHECSAEHSGSPSIEDV